MSTPHVNGDVPISAFLKHVTNYPVVHDGVEYFKANPYGQKSIQLGDSAYKTFAAPVLPYLYKPYQYVQPYVKRVDDLGDKCLSTVDEKWPVVKKPTDELYSDTKGLVLFPLTKSLQTKDHVLEVYNSEYKKADGGGFLLYGKAAFATAIIITAQTVQKIGTFLNSKKQAANEKVHNSNSSSNN